MVPMPKPMITPPIAGSQGPFALSGDEEAGRRTEMAINNDANVSAGS